MMFKERSKSEASVGRPERGGGWGTERDDREKRKHARDRGQMAYVEGTERRPGGWRAEQRDVQDEAGGRRQAGNMACWAWWRDLSVGDCSGNVHKAPSSSSSSEVK